MADPFFMNTHKNWDKYVTNIIDEFNEYPNNQDKWVALNNSAFEVFNYGNINDLKLALTWAKKSVSLSLNSINLDTEANLLYKLGEKKMQFNWSKGRRIRSKRS